MDANRQTESEETQILGVIHLCVFIVPSSPLSERAMAPHSSALAWRNPGTGEPGGLQSMGSLRVGHD